MKKSIVLIWIVILIDLISGLLLTLQLPFARIGLFVKGIVIFLVFITYLTHLHKRTIASVYLAMTIVFIAWVVGSLSSFLNNPEFRYTESLVVLNRYLFLLILICVFIEYSENNLFENECKKVLDKFLIINNTCIFIGLIFGIDMFSTYDPYGEYDETWRFGYKGLIWGQNSVAGIYTLGMAYLFREHFKYRQLKTFLLISTCLAAVFIGTKATWFTLILLSGYYLYVYRIKVLIVLILPALAALSYGFIIYWPIIRDQYMSFMVQHYEVMDFYTFWTSNRNSLLTDAIERMSTQWTITNYIFGDGISYVEMDFFDLYFYFGVSAIIYLYIYMKMFFIKDKSKDNKYFFMVWMAMAFVAGHLINSAIVPVFFLLFIFSANTNLSKHNATSVNSQTDVNIYEPLKT